MLILPMERTFTLNRLPYMTWGLIVINVAIFFGLTMKDQTIIDDAVESYLEQDILSYELPVYQSWLQNEGQFENEILNLESIEEINEDEKYWIAVGILTNVEYQIAAQEELPEYFESNPELLTERAQIILSDISRVSTFKFGLSPASMASFGLFTHQFMHGGFMHLFGNMVILLLIGMTVEQLLGRFNFLLFYLLSGLAGGITYCLVHAGSYTYLVGASGAISGVMGMYVAAYGMQKIRFFYWIGVYFNYFRASALLILPVWVGKELYDFFVTDSNVAYTAHAGGLIIGAALVWVGKQSWLKVDENELDQKDEDEDFRVKLQSAIASLGKADFDVAKAQLWRLNKQYPERERVLELLIQIEKQHPKGKGFHLASATYFKMALKDGHLDDPEVNLLKEYWSKAQPYPLIKNALLNKLIHKLLARQDHVLAEKLLEGSEQHKLMDNKHRTEVLNTFIRFYQNRDPNKISRYKKMLEPG